MSTTQFNVVVADWKDTEALIAGIATVLKEYGITLQQWNAGDDSTILTVAREEITSKDVAEAIAVEEVEEIG